MRGICKMGERFSLKTPVIVGNWKMYKQIPEAVSYAEEILSLLAKHPLSYPSIWLSPPFIAISSLYKALTGSQVLVGAQNMHEEAEGAFTGEISALMLKSAGAAFVILGHSERRVHFGETNEKIHRKLERAISTGLRPILCVGETGQERERGLSIKVIEEQLGACIKTLSSYDSLLIAYEPVWAIGTGKSATASVAQEMHSAIRSYLTKMLGEATAASLPLLYGGSVNAANAKAFLSEPDINGLLVGGASLRPETFFEIIQQGSTQ